MFGNTSRPQSPPPPYDSRLVGFGSSAYSSSRFGLFPNQLPEPDETKSSYPDEENECDRLRQRLSESKRLIHDLMNENNKLKKEIEALKRRDQEASDEKFAQIIADEEFAQNLQHQVNVR